MGCPKIFDASRIFNADKKPNNCIKDLKGKRFGNIVVLEYAGMYRFNTVNRSIWKWIVTGKHQIF